MALFVVQDEVKQSAQKIGPEFEKVFGRNNVKADKTVEQAHKADVVQNGVGNHRKDD